MGQTNIFTVDVEEWYHANYRETDDFHGSSAVVAPTLKLLDLLGGHGSKATFFCLGSVAEQNPDLIREIRRQGHEIASHSYAHKLVYRQSRTEFSADLAKSSSVLEAITGERPIGYRGPSWSVDRKRTPWFWEELEAQGYRYSSSVFPRETFLYGDSSAPRFKYNMGSIVEVPVSTLSLLGQRVPFSGGFYLRLAPRRFVIAATRMINRRDEPVVFYVHPREIDPAQPRIEGLSAGERFIHYCNVGSTAGKIESILSTWKTCSMREYLRL